MAKDKEKDEVLTTENKDEVLTTENAPVEEDQNPKEPISPTEGDPQSDDITMVLEQIAEQNGKIIEHNRMVADLRDDVERIKATMKKKRSETKRGDVASLAGAIKAMSGLALSPDGQQSFKLMCPYLFEE